MPTIESNVFICGTVRNCENYIESVFNNIQRITELFADFRIIIAYDKGTPADKSLIKLTKQKMMYRDKMHIIVNKNPLCNVRTVNIANARNACLNKMREYIQTDFSADYFIMIDMDDVCSGNMDINVFIRAMEKNREWDSISFHRTGYYDIWALSIDSFIYSCWGWSNAWTAVEIIRSYIIKKLDNTPADKLVECRSAFNGFAVYKTDKFIDCHYEGTIPLKYMKYEDLLENQRLLGNLSSLSPLNIQTNERDCEHRSFHMMATDKHGARIRITPEKLFY
jgi:hypothetical protein